MHHLGPCGVELGSPFFDPRSSPQEEGNAICKAVCLLAGRQIKKHLKCNCEGQQAFVGIGVAIVGVVVPVKRCKDALAKGCQRAMKQF